jgi:hypothetical protein
MEDKLCCKDCGVEIVDIHDCEQHSRETEHMSYGFKSARYGV